MAGSLSVVRWSQAGHPWEHHSPLLSSLSQQSGRELNLFDHKTVIIIYLNSGGNKDQLPDPVTKAQVKSPGRQLVCEAKSEEQ